MNNFNLNLFKYFFYVVYYNGFTNIPHILINNENLEEKERVLEEYSIDNMKLERRVNNERNN